MRRKLDETARACRRVHSGRGAWRAPLLTGLLFSLAASGAPAAASGVYAVPVSVDFGSVPVGGPGVERLVQILNMTSGPVIISLVQTTGADPQDFVPRDDVTSPCSGTLAAGSSCITHVIFTPTQAGPRSAVLQVYTDAVPPFTVSLSGTGVTGGTGGGGPLINCPANLTVTAGPGQTTAVVAIGMATSPGAGVVVTGMRGDGRPLNDPYPLGATAITWTAMDPSGNQSTCVQTITVRPVSPSLPIQCPPDQAVMLTAGGTSATVLPGVATSTAAGVTIVGVRSDGKALTDPYPAGTTTITWTATDTNGDAGICTQTITVGTGLIAPTSPNPVVDPRSANPHVDGITPAQGSLYQRAIIHGSGLADSQGTSYVTVGGREVPIVSWSATAIGIVVNPLAYDATAMALNAAYPVEVVAPAAVRQSNSASFFLTDGAPVGSPGGTSGRPHFQSFQQALFCPGDTVMFLGSGFGPTQGTGFVTLNVPLSDPSGSMVYQLFIVPVLSWSDGIVSFVLNLPAGAVPGAYTATVHRNNGKTASGTFSVGARGSYGGCNPAN